MIQASWKQTKVCGGLLQQQQQKIATVTLNHIFNKYEEKGRLGAATWTPDKPNKPHYFYDSDIAKLIEAVAYSLAHYPDNKLKAKIEKVINNLISIQEPDGYLNSYFHNVAPDEKWTDLRIKHELYCAGHLIEAGIAWYQAVGDDKLLKAVCRYADLISRKFGKKAGQIRSWPGHEEIELALVRLYKETEDKKHLDTAAFFVKDRGQNNASYWYDEARRLGINLAEVENRLHIFQAHLPAVKQATAEGHAVRACYFYCGMADIAREKGDKELFNACDKIWRNIVDKRMNVTGGIGSDWREERFTYDYDLAEEYYYETCAQISLFFFAWRMFLSDQQSEFGDIMELTLYNSILSGIDIEGKAFFYSNPLVSVNKKYKFDKEMPEHWGVPVRQQDFSCSCCPPNISRLIMSISQYIYTVSEDSVWINLFIDSETTLKVDNNELSVKMSTNYPWDENITIDIATEKQVSCKFKIRIPGWCKNYEVNVNNQICDVVYENGFAVIKRQWQDKDNITLHLSMPVKIIKAHPAVRQATGKIALKRGPVVYCLEGTDNQHDIFNISLPDNVEFTVVETDISGLKFPGIEFDAIRKVACCADALYYTANEKYETIKAVAIPYCMWANRGANEMTVWLHAPKPA